MAEEEADPRCPECGEAVGVRASYCMHCGAEFIAPVTEGDGSAADQSASDDLVDGVSDAIDGAVDAVDGHARSSDATVESAHSTFDSTAEPTTDSSDGAGSERSAAADSEDDRGLLHPDSILDNSLTVIAGVVLGLLIGVFSLFVFALTTGDVGVVLVVFVWLGSTAVLARRRTVFDAVKYGAYGLAAVLVLIPVAVAIAGGGSAADRVGALVVFLIPMGVVAAVVAGVGYLVGLKGVE